jgi:hypothetical protein
MRVVVALLVAAVALGIASCGSAEPEGPGAARGPLPAIDVVDLRAGGTVPLAEVPAAGTPLLVWFWAPH